MRYCGPRGIPHSHFLGGPNAWTAPDRDKALWWLIHDSQTCGSCGTREQDWDPAEGGHERAFVAEIVSCPGCAALEVGKARMERDEKRGRLPAGSRPALRRQVEVGGG